MSGDVYRFINELDDATVTRIANRLEFRGTDAGFVGMRETYFSKLPFASAKQVLALGCGTGVEIRALLHRSDFHGEILGIDHSPQLIAEAVQRTELEEFSKRVRYQVGDVHALDLQGAEFDIVLAHTLISHVSDPLLVLAEACRVLAPDGVLAVFDGDYASLTFGHPDHELAKRAEERLLDAIINNPRVMRDLPRLVRNADLVIMEANVYAYAEIGVGSFFANMPDAYGPILANSGLLPAADVERWLAWQTQSLAENIFFGACNYYTYLLQRQVAAAGNA